MVGWIWGGKERCQKGLSGRPEERDEVLGEGQPGPSALARESEESCKLPQWGPGRSPGRQRVFPHFKHAPFH